MRSVARPKTTEATEQRRAKVQELHAQRLSVREIARALETTPAAINNDLRAIRSVWRAEYREEIAQAQERDLAALARDEVRVRQRLARVGESDHKSFVALGKLLLEIMERRSKLLGTDAPQRIDQKVDVTGLRPLTIEYHNDWLPKQETKTIILDAVTPGHANGNGNGA